MPSERFAVALRELQAGDWLLFEKLAAEFLAVEFPSLRTTAAAAGDKGRDGQLYVPNEDLKTACQYSVTADWSGKIRRTLETLKANFPKVDRLIYCTNQVIGPAADDLVEELRRRGIALDIRDASWFVSRELTAPQREVAAEELSRRIVDPMLAARGLGDRAGAALSESDARVALVHLTLSGYDRDSDKGLTKSCFESLVLAALHDTTADTPKDVEIIRSEVRALVPSGDLAQVQAQVDGALSRLSVRNGPVKQIGKSSQYHLAFSEQQRIREGATRFIAGQEAVEKEIEQSVRRILPDLDDNGVGSTVLALKLGIETVLLRKGEAFATAVRTGEFVQLGTAEVLEVLNSAGAELAHLSVEAATEIIVEILTEPSPETRDHLRRLADGYTLFGFLQQTPDVQKVMVTVFSNGEVWLDTTIVLPLLVETLLDDPEDRHYTALMRAAVDAGLRLYVTDGVIEEVERHIHRALIFARTAAADWQTNVPFLYAGYALAGRARGAFFDWLTEFRGAHTPEEDIKEYLHEAFHITSRNLIDVAESADAELTRIFHELDHLGRRGVLLPRGREIGIRV